MKFLKAIGVLSLLIFLMYSCKTSNQSATTMENIHRKWMLIQYKDFTKDELVKLDANMDLTTIPDSPDRYTAKMGCNGMFFTAKFNNGTSQFSRVGATRMYCEDRMKLEGMFSNDLPKMIQYKIDGHYLTLTDGTTSMKFVAADWD